MVSSPLLAALRVSTTSGFWIETLNRNGRSAGRIVLHAGAQYQHQPQRHQTGKVLFHIGFHFIPLNLYYLYRVSAALHPGPTAAIL